MHFYAFIISSKTKSPELISLRNIYFMLSISYETQSMLFLHTGEKYKILKLLFFSPS